MRILTALTVMLMAVALVIGCETDRQPTLAPPFEDDGASAGAMNEATLAEAAQASTEGWTAVVTSFEREVIAGDIAHYSFQMTVGDGPYDVIGMHRVVKERAPFVPIRSRNPVFLAHGDLLGFEGSFLLSASSANIPDDQAFPVYLAENGIDVWGIDFSWALVPPGLTDFSFMADWGIDRQVHDLGIALSMARNTRLGEGSGFLRMHLLGYSRGGQVGYAYLNAETQVPYGQRHVRGFIVTDIAYKTNDETYRQTLCEVAAAQQASYDSGVFEDQTGVLAQTVSFLAQSQPDDPSPVVPGLTNYQAAIFAGSLTYNFAPNVPYYHWLAGTFDEYGLPTGFQFTQVPPFLDFLATTSPYEALKLMLEAHQVGCDEVDLPYDDYLSQITVPVLNVGAGGGFGDYGVYSTSLLGSVDVTHHIVDLQPPEARVLDYGHVDLFLAENAESLVWQPVLTWLEEHARPARDSRDVKMN